MEEAWKPDMETRMKGTQEEWIRLKQINIPDGQFIVTSFIQDLSGVKIVLDDEKNIVEYFFDGIPVLIRIATEVSRMRTWAEIQLKYKDKSFFRNWFLYQIKNSELINWIVEESCGFCNAEQLNHYCFVTIEELIDIVVSFEPTVTVFKFSDSNGL